MQRSTSEAAEPGSALGEQLTPLVPDPVLRVWGAVPSQGCGTPWGVGVAGGAQAGWVSAGALPSTWGGFASDAVFRWLKQSIGPVRAAARRRGGAFSSPSGFASRCKTDWSYLQPGFCC